MEKYSFEKAHDEAFEIQKKALEKKYEDKDPGSLSKEDYEDTFYERNKLVETLSDCFWNLDIKTVFKIKTELPAEVFQSVIEELLMKKLKNSLGGRRTRRVEKTKEYDKFDNIINFINELELSVEVLKKIGKEVIIHLLDYHAQIEMVIKIKNALNLPEEIFQENEVRSVAQYAFLRALINGDIAKAFMLQKFLKFSDDIIIHQAEEAIFSCLYNRNVDSAIEIKKAFGIKLKCVKLFEKFTGMREIVETFEACGFETMMNFRDEIFLMHLTRFNEEPQDFIDEIMKNPFLLDALNGNKQYGIRLLLKFEEFDDIAQQNIQKLYEIKAKIKNQRPDLDQNSSEFRMLMQKNLIGFKNNKKILVEIGKSGVDIRQWLTYSAEKHFDLGKEDETLFSEQIQSPIKRIDETIGKYLTQVSSVLTSFKAEINSAEIPSDKKTELAEKLLKMQLQIIEARQNGNNEKTEGIQKGITNLENQIAQLKSTTVWNKLIGDLNNVKILGNELAESYKELKVLEEEQGNATDRKKQIKLKEKIKQYELKIKAKVVNLDDTLTEFQKTASELLTKVLGGERAKSMIQEIAEATGRDFDHYREDLSTIQKLFKRDSSSLEKTPMRVGIAPRNPDTDLYLGNDCPCCIRIDSDIHGAECPIADFMTDLGMHNIVVYDEKRNKPVATAWCFIGKNNDSSDPILVIDNIEANTDYSIPFRFQLSRELGGYIKHFARACGIKKVIQGPYNNDLKVGKLLEVDEKLGGVNRVTGYYLEAERDKNEGYEEDLDDDYVR